MGPPPSAKPAYLIAEAGPHPRPSPSSPRPIPGRGEKSKTKKDSSASFCLPSPGGGVGGAGRGAGVRALPAEIGDNEAEPPMTATVCYFIQSHRDPPQIERLIRVLRRGSPRAKIL